MHYYVFDRHMRFAKDPLTLFLPASIGSFEKAGETTIKAPSNRECFAIFSVAQQLECYDWILQPQIMLKTMAYSTVPTMGYGLFPHPNPELGL